MANMRVSSVLLLLAACLPGISTAQETGGPSPALLTSEDGIVAQVPEGQRFGYKYGAGATHFLPEEGVQAVQDRLSSQLGDVQGELGAVQERVGRDIDGISSTLVDALASQITVAEAQLAATQALQVTQQDILDELKKQTLALASGGGAASSGGAVWIQTSQLSATTAGGQKITVVGRNFLPGLAGLYKCRWTVAGGDAEADFHLLSATVAADTDNKLGCVVPKWEGHPITTAKQATTFTVMEGIVPLPFTMPNNDGPEFVFNALAPTLSGLSPEERSNSGDAVGGKWSRTLNVLVEDVEPTGDDGLQLSFDYTRGKPGCLESITSKGSSNQRAITLVFTEKDCNVNGIKVTVTDEQQLKTSFTFSYSLLSAINIVKTDGVHKYADGKTAQSCASYKNPTKPYVFEGDTDSGIYLIGGTVKTYCEMGLGDGGWTLLATNGNTGTNACDPCIGCTSNLNSDNGIPFAACGSVTSSLSNDFRMSTVDQRKISWDSMILVTYNNRNYNSKSAAFGIGFPGGKRATTPKRTGGKPFSVKGLEMIRCLDSCGASTAYMHDTPCANSDLQMTKFGQDSGTCMVAFKEANQNRGWDDYQDGCGCSDNWSPKRVRDHAAAVFVR